jgi:hypothetical protein
MSLEWCFNVHSPDIFLPLKSMQCIQSSEELLIILCRKSAFNNAFCFFIPVVSIIFSINLNLYDNCANINYFLSELHDLFIYFQWWTTNLIASKISCNLNLLWCDPKESNGNTCQFDALKCKMSSFNHRYLWTGPYVAPFILFFFF